MTDVAILIIPITLLWKVKLATYQKIAIGTFLCLSAVMIVLAIIRAAGVHYYNNTDNSWTFLWQQVEASAAVAMFSLTAFRSVFTNSARPSRGAPWKVSIPRFIKRTRTTSISSQRHLQDISIPSATMTGMKTTIENMKGDDLSLE